MKESKYILLDHGSGGLATQKLVSDIFLPFLKNQFLEKLEDSAELDLAHGRIAFTTDTYVVDPIFFPGGDIGSLAVYGTVNDLSVKGAKPLYISLALILEEGLELDVLKKIIESIARAAEHCNVKVVTGDTKVVPKGKADKIFINTSGVGLLSKFSFSPLNIKVGDVVIVSGTLGDHGVTILTQREGLSMDCDLKSDSQPLHELTSALIEKLGDNVHAMRDPTRGGLATCLCEMANAANVEIELDESSLPIRKEVEAACEVLGLDPLYLANEGKAVFFVDKDYAQQALEIIKNFSIGKEARIIGQVISEGNSRVLLKTLIGGKRVIEPLSGEPLPRIC